ncbi:MAG TPA: PRC-barrel domain-containing protein [Verrucomicrobiae bacterium]|nr:PRC-barrel domain-containing protein [Verrucomicrobiae bacterium]
MNPTVLNDKKVIGSEGFILGEVEGVNVDLNTWRASLLYVRLSDEAAAGLGLKRSFSKTTICLPINFVKSVGDVITLNEPLHNLENVAANQCFVNPTKLKGKKVIGAKGHNVGEIESLDLEPRNWQITGIQVSLTNEAATELGCKPPFLSRVVISIPTKIVKSVGNMINLNEDIQDFKALVKCLQYS